MGISYPNKIAAKRGLESRLINKQQYNSIINKLSNKQRPPMNTALGGQVGIHTIKNGDKYIYGGITRNNWTYGCIALEYEDMKNLFFKTKTKDTKVLIIGKSFKKNILFVKIK